MAKSEKQSFGQQLNMWVQTIGIIIAACWAVYTFIYKEITLPESAPVNVTVTVELRKIKLEDVKNKDRNKHLIPVEIKAQAKNPTSREVYLLPTAWIASGAKIDPLTVAQPILEKTVVASKTQETYIHKHFDFLLPSVVAGGSLFRDTSLKPNETVTRTLIIYMPPDEYDVLEVQTAVATVAKMDAVDLEWRLTENLELEPTLYGLTASGERIEMKRDSDGSYSDKKLELQMANARSELCLW